jgi:predicted porin
VNLGDYYGAATSLEVVAPTVGIGQADLAPFGAAGQAALFWATEDTPFTKITYLTPSFAGFQAGVSYTPEQDSGRSIQKSGIRAHDVVEVAGQYAGEFGPVGVTVGGGYEFAQTSVGLGDYEIWNVGAQVAFYGFTVGASYFDNGEYFLASDGIDQQHSWALGATYATGPFGVGASYVRTTSQIGNDDQKDQVWGVGGAYKLAPGLSLQADVNYIDAETAGDNQAVQLVVRTRVDF